MEENNNFEEFNNEMETMPNEPNNNSGTNKGPMIALIAVIVVVIGAIAIGVMGTKSKTEEFLELFVDDYMFESMGDLGNVIFEEGKIVTDISLNPSLVNSVMGESVEAFDRLAIVSELNTKDMDFSGKSYLDIDSTELVSVEYAKTGEAIGFTVPDLMNENIVVKNENLKELAKKFGMSEEEITQIPDKISLEEIMKLVNQNEQEQEKNTEELNEILKKYQKPIENIVEDLLVVEEEKSIVINDTSIVTEKHSLSLTEKDGYELIRELLLVAKDDKELYNMIKEEEEADLGDVTFEEWKSEIETSITEIEKSLVNSDDVNSVLELSAYVKGNDTMAIELYIPSEEMNFRVATLNQKDFYYTEFAITIESDEVKIIFETMTSDKTYEGKLSTSINTAGVNVTMDILDYSIKYSDKANVEKLDLTKDFVLNDRTEEEIETKFEEIGNNITSYSEKVMEKAPESLKALIGVDSTTEE